MKCKRITSLTCKHNNKLHTLLCIENHILITDLPWLTFEVLGSRASACSPASSSSMCSKLRNGRRRRARPMNERMSASVPPSSLPPSVCRAPLLARASDRPSYHRRRRRRHLRTRPPRRAPVFVALVAMGEMSVVEGEEVESARRSVELSGHRVTFPIHGAVNERSGAPSVTI